MPRLNNIALSAAAATVAVTVSGCASRPMAHELPAAVRATAMASVDGLEITSVETFSEGGVTFYDILGEANGQIWDMEILEGGRMLELERAMRVEDLPTSVSEAVLQRFDSGTITGAEPYQENGIWFYELEVEDAGHTYDVEVDESGVMYGIQQAVPLATLPVAVRNAAERAVPGVVLLEAERGVDDEAGVFTVEGIASLRTYEVTVSANGEVLGVVVEHDLAGDE